MTSAALAYGGIDLRGRVEAASPHALVQLLFDELLGALRQAELCIRSRDISRKGERVSRAVTILGGLDSSLNHEKGGSLSEHLSQVYRQARREILVAARTDDAERARAVTAMVGEVATAWRQIA